MDNVLDNVRRTRLSDDFVTKIADGKCIIDRQLSAVWHPIRTKLIEAMEQRELEDVDSFVARGGKIERM